MELTTNYTDLIKELEIAINDYGLTMEITVDYKVIDGKKVYTNFDTLFHDNNSKNDFLEEGVGQRENVTVMSTGHFMKILQEETTGDYKGKY